MLKQVFTSPFPLVLLLLALVASLALNYALFRKAIGFYTRELEVRLTPVDPRYAQENQRLLAQAKTRPRIVIFGESRCAMWRPHHPDNWGDIQFINRGIGGESTAQIRARLENDVLQLDPDLVILQMGDNDLKGIAVLPERKDWIIEQTLENIIAIAESIAAREIPVALTTIFPTGRIELARRPIWSPEVNDAIDRVNERLLAIDAPYIAPIDCDAILRHGRYIKSEYELDTLHLTPAGYHALNRELEPIIKQLLTRPKP